MNYTEKLMKELERVTLRGNADKETVRNLAAIIFDMEQRIISLESGAPVAEEPAVEEPAVEEEKPRTNKRRVEPKTEDK